MLVNSGVDSGIGGADVAADGSAAVGEAGGGFADIDEAVETSAGGGGDVAGLVAAGVIVDSTGGAGGSLFDPKGHQLEACRIAFILETGTCHCCNLRLDEGPLRRCMDV